MTECIVICVQHTTKTLHRYRRRWRESGQNATEIKC